MQYSAFFRILTQNALLGHIPISTQKPQTNPKCTWLLHRSHAPPTGCCTETNSDGLLHRCRLRRVASKKPPLVGCCTEATSDGLLHRCRLRRIAPQKPHMSGCLGEATSGRLLNRTHSVQTYQSYRYAVHMFQE